MIYVSKDRKSGFESDSENLGIIRSFGYTNILCCEPEALAKDEELEVTEETDFQWDDFSIEGLYKTMNMSQKDMANYFDIPLRTLQEWLQGRRTPPSYVVKMMSRIWMNKK